MSLIPWLSFACLVALLKLQWPFRPKLEFGDLRISGHPGIQMSAWFVHCLFFRL